MKSRICPYRRHCHSVGTCKTCDFGKAFENLSDKIKCLKNKNRRLEEENEKLKERIDTLLNPNLMKIPKQIKIGGFNYNVERPTTHFIGDNNAVLDGQCDTTGKTIKVSAVGCEEYQEVVFLHEVCHAIINHYVSWDEQDEKFVEQFAKGLYQVLVDNKDIFGSDTE